MHETWSHPNGAHGSWDQVFSADPQSNALITKQTGSNGWVFTGTSTGFVGNVIDFTGTQLTPQGSFAVRERFAIAHDGEFAHIWERHVNDAWVATSTAECTRKQ